MDGRFAKITRLSFLAGVLESADTVPEFLYETIQNLYGKIGEDVGEDVGEEAYELDGVFAPSEKIGDSEEEGEEWQEAAELYRGDNIEPTAHVSDSEEQEADAWQGTADVQGEESTEPTELDSAITSQGEEVHSQVDCKKCRAAQILESSKTEDEPHMLSSDCSTPKLGGIPQHTSIRAETAPTSDEGDDREQNSERTVQGFDTPRGRASNLLSWMADKLREAADAFYVNADGHAKIEPLSRETSQSDLVHAKPGNESKVEVPSMTLESELEHSKDCPRNKKPIRPSTPESEEQSAIASSGDVWARIGRMVQNWGVPSAMIEEHEADIAEMIVQTMKGEQNKAEKSEKADALRATHAVSKTERYADITVAELAGDQTNETVTRKLKETLGIGPPLAEAESIRKFKPVDMELARLDPAIIAAKKSDYQKPVVHKIYTNTLGVGTDELDAPTASDKSQLLAVPERHDEIRNRVAEISDMEVHSAKAQQEVVAHSKGPPSTIGQRRPTKGIKIEGGNAFPYDKSSSYELKGIHEKRCWEGNRSRNTSVSRNGTQGSSTPSGLGSSGSLKDEHGDEPLLSRDTSGGGVPLAAKQASGANVVMDDSQSMKENEPSRAEIGYDYERSFITNEYAAEPSNEEYVLIDNGGFNMNDICVGLGEDTLDEERFDRLRTGFMQVLQCTLGLI